jgi:hypothetical protein
VWPSTLIPVLLAKGRGVESGVTLSEQLGSFFETRVFLERVDTPPAWTRVSSGCMMSLYAQLAACGEGGSDKATERGEGKSKRML